DFRRVTGRRRGGVRVDVVDLGVHARQCHPHAAFGAFTRRRDHIVAIGGGAIDDVFAVDTGAARLGTFELLQHHAAGAARNHHAIAADVVGTRGGRGRIIVFR